MQPRPALCRSQVRPLQLQIPRQLGQRQSGIRNTSSMFCPMRVLRQLPHQKPVPLPQLHSVFRPTVFCLGGVPVWC